MRKPETAAQILLRTALRYYPIRHLDLPAKKRLMSLSEEEYLTELSNMDIKPLYLSDFKQAA